MISFTAIRGSVISKPGSAGYFSGAFIMAGENILELAGKSIRMVKPVNLLPLKHIKNPVMIQGIFNKPLFRLPLYVAISFPLKLLLDIIFGVIYKNYAVIRPFEEYTGAAVLTVITLETVLLVKRKLNQRINLDKNPLRRLLIEMVLNSLLLSVVITLSSLAIKLFLVKTGFIQLTDEVITTIFYLIFLVYVPAFGGFALFLLNRWRTSLVEIERYKKENAEYRFETLRTQVNPHFLFNSLNTLSSLMYEDLEKAAGFIRDLSDVYRYVLENRNRETISLREELKFIRSFVFLYQLRFENKLSFDVNIPENLQEKLIAPMTLQLLVENAVKHNIISVKKPLGISVTADEFGFLTVKNNLQKKPAGVTSSEIGLQNISSRYAYLTDKPVEVTETKSEFIVKVPLI